MVNHGRLDRIDEERHHSAERTPCNGCMARQGSQASAAACKEHGRCAFCARIVGHASAGIVVDC
jgi:hypothetical protein